MSHEFSDSDIQKMDSEFQKSKNKAEELLKDKEKTQKTIDDAFAKAVKNEGPISKVFDQLKLLFSIVKDYVSGAYREIPYGSIVAILAGILYFLSPIDLIPDFIPVVGYIDDVFIIGLVIKQVYGDLEKYERWKNAQKKIS